MPPIDSILAAAQAAFADTRDLPAPRRAELLDAIAANLETLGEPLLLCAHEETALPVRPRLENERARTTHQLRLFAELIREGSWVEARLDGAVRSLYQPLGPVVVFDASNFPLAFGAAGGDTASALAAGCPVILKSHPAHPRTNRLAAEAIRAALRTTGLPPGLFALAEGGRDIGAALVQHPATAAVAFTGSLRGGRALFDLAAARPKPIPVFAEMGSLNPVVVLPGAFTATVATGLAQSITLGAGQFCTKPGLLLLVGAADEFVHLLRAALAATGPFAMISRAIQAEFLRHCPGDIVRATLLETTASAWRQQRELHDEIFGPAAVVVRCAGEAEVRAVLEMVGGSLTGTVHYGNGDQPQPVLGWLRDIAGRVIANGYPTGVEVCHAMVHGGPYPATTAPQTTSVGTRAMYRFVRPVCYQNVPDPFLPPALQDANPLGIRRLVNGQPENLPLASAGFVRSVA